MRYFIEHSYNGTAYCGWQKQPNGMTIQEAIEKALSVVLREPIEITGSSRTDTGVHAIQQFAHFDIDTPIKNLNKTAHSVSSILPFDIVVDRIVEVSDETHARFDATHRCYEYKIYNKKNAFLHERVYVFRPKLDVEAMNEAAQILLQYIDFECFSKIHTEVKTFLCSIEYAQWEYQNGLLVFKIKANRFLRGMVRAIVGTLLDIGIGKLSKQDFKQIVISKNRKNASAQAPACGLYLTEVGYDFI